MNNLGMQIKNIREFKNLTQTYVAKKIGMSQSKLARIEKGNIIITDEQLSLIAGVLETDNDAIKHFDEKVYDQLKSKTEFTANHIVITLFFQKLKELHKEEIKILEKKVKLLESL